MDERIKKLAKNLVNHSVKLNKGEKVLIFSNGVNAMPLIKQLVKEVYTAGAMPFVSIWMAETLRELLLCAGETQIKIMAENDAALMKQMDAYISVGSNPNSSELSDVPAEKLEMYNRLYFGPVHRDVRLKKKWVGCRYPTPGMAQSDGKSMEAFEDFFFDVCCMDYAKMGKAMENLKALMERTDNIRITGQGTDLSFSIKGIPAIPCAGECNIPDGEIFTAPVKNSVNGYVTFNTPSEHEGFTYENIKLTFKDGKIISSESNDTERITKVFNTDEGARYVGEFALGVNPFIVKPMKNTLFDEKISGSFHFTPGNCYDEADNGNKSAIHWDLVCIQTKEYGGGEMYFDGTLVRKDGVFVVPELLCLNPENLK